MSHEDRLKWIVPQEAIMKLTDVRIDHIGLERIPDDMSDEEARSHGIFPVYEEALQRFGYHLSVPRMVDKKVERLITEAIQREAEETVAKVRKQMAEAEAAMDDEEWRS